ncbi:hypothetical protein ANN_23592 [Periplaneta americana]|uniref:Uncharacterized protein n=1 Tax=Periplaneta americana TaxID=6978 RepID=A0ABQ8SMF5_PERAM|nr:hypothetical protein ANN_23592 [Periplaneta americana]
MCGLMKSSHAPEETRHQHRFSINLRAGILGDRLRAIRAATDNYVACARYQDFLINVLPILLEYVSCQQRLQMWFMHDGTPAHFFRSEREQVTLTFQDRLIDWGGPKPWPARSSNLNPLDLWLSRTTSEARCPPSIVMHLGSYDRKRNPVAKASYSGWEDHRANHTIPPFWVDDRPPLLRHVGVRPAAS